MGEAVGVFTLNGAGAWQGELRRVSLEELPLSELWPGLAAQGELDGVVDLHLQDVGPVGRVDFEAHEGSLTLPGVRMAIPFEFVEGAVAFEEDTRVTIEALVLEGPLLSADVRGQLAPTEPLGDSRIALEIEVQSEPGIRSLLESAGMIVNDDGSAVLRLGGTVANPRMR
jgi:type II secretion system protein N